MIEERTYIIDHLSQWPYKLYQDVSAYVVHEQTTWNSTTSPTAQQSTLTLHLERTAADNPSVREGYRVINGFWDTDAGSFVTARVGGYITRNVRTQQASLLQFTCTIGDYSRYLTRRRILAWPTGPDPPYTTFPPEYSVERWLTGEEGDDGLEWPGLLRAHYSGMRWDGLGRGIADIVLGVDTMPGNLGTYYGQYGFTMMDTALADILGCAAMAYNLHYNGPLLTPGFWVEQAIAPGGEDIIPRIRIDNTADLQRDPVATVFIADTDPLNTTDAPIWLPYTHEREMGPANNVTVLGEGFDPTLADRPIVWGEANIEEHDQRYWAEFSTEARWDDVLVEPRIHTLATAAGVAAAIEAQTGAGRGSYGFTSERLIAQPGEWIRLIKPDEDVDSVFPVRQVDMIRSGVVPRYRYRVGFDIRSAQDVLAGGAINTRLTLEQLNFKLGRLAALPGTPRPTTVSRSPVHSEQNAHQARFYNIVLSQYKASLNAPLVADDPNGLSRAHLVEMYGSDGQRRMSAGPQGEPRGHSLMVGTLTAAGSVSLAITQTMRFVRHVITASGTPGTATYKVNGTTVTFPFTVTNGQRLTVTAASVPSGGMEISLCEFPAEPVS